VKLNELTKSIHLEACKTIMFYLFLLLNFRRKTVSIKFVAT